MAAILNLSTSQLQAENQESENNVKNEGKTFISSPDLHAILHENLLNLLKMKNFLLNPNQEILSQQKNSNFFSFLKEKNITAKEILQSKRKYNLNEFKYKKIDIEKCFQEADDAINKKVKSQDHGLFCLVFF